MRFAADLDGPNGLELRAVQRAEIVRHQHGHAARGVEIAPLQRRRRSRVGDGVAVDHLGRAGQHRRLVDDAAGDRGEAVGAEAVAQVDVQRVVGQRDAGRAAVHRVFEEVADVGAVALVLQRNDFEHAEKSDVLVERWNRHARPLNDDIGV